MTDWLNDLESLERDATPGPWEAAMDGWTIRPKADETPERRGTRITTTWATGGAIEKQVADAEFIAAARNALPKLLRIAKAAKEWRRQLGHGSQGDVELAEHAILSALEAADRAT